MSDPEKDALKAQLAAAEEEMARLRALALFQSPELKVHTEARPPDPTQRQLILDYHAKHWAAVLTMSGEAQKKEALEFARLIRSGLEARVITPEEAQAWILKVTTLLGAA